MRFKNTDEIENQEDLDIATEIVNSGTRNEDAEMRARFYKFAIYTILVFVVAFVAYKVLIS